MKATVHVPLAEFRVMLARAYNTEDPHKVPQWAMDLSDELTEHDKITIVVERPSGVKPAVFGMPQGDDQIIALNC